MVLLLPVSVLLLGPVDESRFWLDEDKDFSRWRRDPPRSVRVLRRRTDWARDMDVKRRLLLDRLFITLLLERLIFRSPSRPLLLSCLLLLLLVPGIA